MEPSWHRRVGAAAVLTSVALVASACGSSGNASSGNASSSSPSRAVDAAYTTTMKAKTARFSFTETAQGGSATGSSSVSVSGKGEVDFSDNAFQMSINSPTGGTIKLLETKAMLYIEVPSSDRSQISEGKPWASVNLNQVDEDDLGKSFSQLASVMTDSPTDALSELQSVSKRVTKSGTATIDGVTTTGYKATVDLTKVAAKVKETEGGKAAQAITDEEKALGATTLPVEVWIDNKGMVRRYESKTATSSSATGSSASGTTATLTITLSDFGSAVHVTAPSAAQVANVTSKVIAATKQSS